MPRVTVSTMEGVTLEQKRGLAKEITEVVVRKLNVPPEAVQVSGFRCQHLTRKDPRYSILTPEHSHLILRNRCSRSDTRIMQW